jgi:hypothetical protein
MGPQFWKPIAFAAAMLAPAAAPGLWQAPQVGKTLPASVTAAPAEGKTFAATCRGDQVLDSRPDPAWVRQSFAHDNCVAPLQPAALDGFRASRAQVVAAMTRAKAYQAAAGAFQACVSQFVAQRQAAGARPLSQAELIIENHRILTSQRAKERAQAQVNIAINQFNEYGSECPDHG